jgi:hypothetical protein
MRHSKTLHLIVLAGWGASTVIACSVKSDGLGAVGSGAASGAAAAPAPGAGGQASVGAPGSGGGPMPPGGAGAPPATSGPGAGPIAGGTGGNQPGAGSGGDGLASPGTGGESAAGSGVGVSTGGEVGTASGGAGTAGSQGSLPAGSGGMKAAGTGGEGTGGKRDVAGTGGGSGGGRAAGSGGSGATPDCSGMPKPPVAPGDCSKGPSVLACAESATDPGQWGWVVTCPGQDPTPVDGGASDARQSGDGGTADVCSASLDCPMNQVCTTQDGVCSPPPGCPSMGGRACSGGCYGTCRAKMAPPPSGGCRLDGDCRIQADTCMGCSCIALGQNEMPPSCQGQGQGQGRGPGQGSKCFQDPCSSQHARCQQGSCVASPN